MASTAGTSWTCITMDLLRTSLHVEGKEASKILKHLNPLTLKLGTRFLSQQTKVTQGARHVRLDAWYYVRRVRDEEVISAVREAGWVDTALHSKIREAMESQKVYHVLVRGNDPIFMPPGDRHGTDIVTSYLCERVSLVRDEVDKYIRAARPSLKYLFEDLGNESAIRQFMQTPNFDDMLRVYFYTGDTEREATLHLVGRFHGPSNLLHACIKEGHVETLRLLLEHYTVESQQETPWRVLAEPLRGVGKFMVSAFHRAVFDGQRTCLEELVEWAKRHGHDITKLRNVEERNEALEPTGLTCLELAEKEGNMGCYNVLAPIFGVLPKQDAVDRNTRGDRHALLRQPRVEFVLFGNEVPEKTVPLVSFAWEDVLAAVGKLASSRACRDANRSLVLFRICSVTFASDISTDQAEQLFVLAAGASLLMERCEVKSERTLLALLATLVNRLEGDDTGGELLPPACPIRVDVSSPVLDEPGTVDEETELDLQAAALVTKFVSSVGRWPGFIAARNGVLSVKQRVRLQRFDDGGRAWAAMWAAIYSTRVAAFMFYDQEVEGQLHEWLRARALVPLARAVFKFYSPEEVLTKEPSDPRSALNPAVIHFLRYTLSAWFALFPKDVADPWHVWAERLGSHVTQLDIKLAPALDIVLESLLRMWHALDFACKGSPDVGAASIADLVTQCVPQAVLAGGHLPRTAARMAKYAAPKVANASPAGRLSLTAAAAAPVSLRPAWARPRAVRS